MSKFNKLSKDVPPTEHDFPISVEGDVTKKRFLGDFTCKIPTRKEQCLIDKHRAFLNGELVDQLSPSTIKFHHMISYLRYTLTDYPRFWKQSDLGYEMHDENVVAEIYSEVLDFEVEWLKEVWGEEAVAKLQKSGDEEDENERKRSSAEGQKEESDEEEKSA